MKKLPSLKTLAFHFGTLGPAIREVLEWHWKEDLDLKYPAFKEWVEKHHHIPRSLDQQMWLLNHILQGHGVECLQKRDVFGTPEMQYVNMGDTYVTTIIWDDGRKAWFIEGYGDWVEKAERRGLKFD